MTRKLRALLWMIRPHSCVLASLYVLIGLYMGDMPADLAAWRVLLCMAIVFAVVAYSFIINDCCDIEVDRVAKPERPLPSGLISRFYVCRVLAGLAVFSLALAVPLGWQAFVYVSGTLLFATAYSTHLKQVPFVSHMTIAGLNASIILFSVIVNGSMNANVWYLVAAVFLYTSSSELLYAVQDREGDMAAGIRTTATVFGPSTSLYVFRVMVIVLALWGLVPVLLRTASQWYSYSILPLGVLPLIGITIYITFVRDYKRGVDNSRVMMKAVRYMYLIPVLLLPLSAS